jgi:hypothetical protein
LTDQEIHDKLSREFLQHLHPESGVDWRRNNLVECRLSHPDSKVIRRGIQCRGTQSSIGAFADFRRSSLFAVYFANTLSALASIFFLSDALNFP